MCCDSWGRKESDTTEQLKCTAPYKLLVLVYHYRQHNWVFKIRIPMSKQYGSSREDILTLFSLPAAAKSASVVSDSVQPHRRQSTRLLRPWDFPGKSSGVGCHCLGDQKKVQSLGMTMATPQNFKAQQVHQASDKASSRQNVTICW